MENSKHIREYVQLLLAKLELTKLRYCNQGYDWSMLGKEGQKQVEQAMAEIDNFLRIIKQTIKAA